MQLKSALIHIALLPLYISLASFFGIVPPITSLVKLARNNLPQRFFNQKISTSHSNIAIPNAMNFVARRSRDRGQADHGWLKTFHTFSFASYQDMNHEQFGPLRVINEDRVAPRTGFGTHSHREFEIFSYVVNGELEHKDSMNNIEVLKRGDIQLTSAGTGIAHSEKAHGAKQVHFLQIWSLPKVSRLPPKYFTRHFSDEEKQDKWVKVVAPVESKDVDLAREAKGPVPVQSDLSLYATLLNTGKKLDQPLGGRKGYIHVIQTSGYNPDEAQGATVKISGPGYESLELKEGDGAYIEVGQRNNVLQVENIGSKRAEVLLFDLE